jgi:hypothetical protein
MKPPVRNADCKRIARQWQAVPVQLVLDAVLLQDAMGYGLFVVGHHTPAFSTQSLQSAKPSGIEITAMPHLRQGDMSMPDRSSSSASRFCHLASWLIMSPRSASQLLQFVCVMIPPQSLSR